MADAGDARRMQAIIDRLRGTYGVEVREIAGWQSRGATWARVPTGIIDHHDASSRKSGEWGALGIIRDGRPGIPGPLSQFQIARCLDGKPRLAVVAAGRANHAGTGGPRVGVPANAGNSYLYGAEAANDGVGEPYTLAAHYAHDALFRAVADVCGFPVGNVIGHREWTSRKSDPVYDMGWRRAGVAGITAKSEDIMASLDDLRRVVREEVVTVFRRDMGFVRDQVLTRLGIERPDAYPAKLPRVELDKIDVARRVDVGFAFEELTERHNELRGELRELRELVEKLLPKQ